jgi:hypothetical protein
MPRWQELGWPSEQAWIDAGRPEMTPAQFLNSDTPAGGGSTGGASSPWKGTSITRLRELYASGQLSPEEFRRELEARDYGVAAIEDELGQVQAPAASITPPTLEGGGGLKEMVLTGDTGNWNVVNRAGEHLAGPFRTKELAANAMEDIALGVTQPATVATSGSPPATPPAGGSGAGGGGGAAAAATGPEPLTANQLVQLVQGGYLTEEEAIARWEQLASGANVDPLLLQQQRDQFLRALNPERAAQMALQGYAAQNNAKFFSTGENTGFIYAQDPASAGAGIPQLRRVELGYNPATGQVETLTGPISGAASARATGKQIEATGQFPLTPVQQAAVEALGLKGGALEQAGRLLGTNRALSLPEISSVFGGPVARSVSTGNVPRSPAGAYSFDDLVALAGGPVGATDVTNQIRSAIGLTPLADTRVLQGGGGYSVSQVRENAQRNAEQLYPGRPDLQAQYVDSRVASWFINIATRNPLGITPQERTQLVAATGRQGVLPENTSPEAVAAALGTGTYTETIGDQTTTRVMRPDEQGPQPGNAAARVARLRGNFGMFQSEGERVGQPGSTTGQQGGPGIYIRGPDGATYGPFASEQEAQAAMTRLALQLGREQDQRRRERADVLAGRIPARTQQPLGRRQPNQVSPDYVRPPSTGTPGPAPPPPAPVTTLNVYQSGGQQPNTLIGTKPLGTLEDPFPLLQQHGAVNLAGMSTPLASMAGPMNAGSHLDLLARQRFPMMLNQGGGFQTPEEIAMVGTQTGRVYAVAGEGPDGLGGMAAPERITVQPEAPVDPRMSQLAALAAAKYPVQYQLAGVR